MLAGGEPTLYRQGLLSLIHELDAQKVILSTNGYLLDRSLLENLGGITVHIDLKTLVPPSFQQPSHNHIYSLNHVPASTHS
jgi:molybdenum cofactor biosynthesis enzyme MoaA